jgi:hypothetical protein
MKINLHCPSVHTVIITLQYVNKTVNCSGTKNTSGNAMTDGFICDFLQWYSPTSCGHLNISQDVTWIMLPFSLRQYGKKDPHRTPSTGPFIYNY